MYIYIYYILSWPNCLSVVKEAWGENALGLSLAAGTF